MAPNPRVQAAFRAMKDLGIKEAIVKPVLKKLLRLYEKNWELIEAENYRVLVDAIFEEEDNVKQQEEKPGNDVNEDDLEGEGLGQETERPLKRLRRGRDVNQPQIVTGSLEPTNEGCSISPQQVAKNKGKQPMISEPPVQLQRFSPLSSPGKLVISDRASQGLCLREPMAETGSDRFPKQIEMVPSNHQFIKPKDEPFTDDMSMDDIPQYKIPIAVIHPDPSSEKDPPMENDGSSKEMGKESSSQYKDGERRANGIRSSDGEMESSIELANKSQESSCNLDVATSPLGEVKLSLSCNSAVRRLNFRMPNLDAVIRMTEEKCQHSYKVIDPKFSVMKLLRHVCESFLELGTDSIDKSQDDHVQASERTLANGCARKDKNSEQIHVSGRVEKHKDREMEDPELTNVASLVVVPQLELFLDDLRCRHNIEDIAKGEERVRIPWINEINSEFPPFFHYISQSLVFQNAEITISLSRIGDLSCCPTCFGNCVSASVPCACARETGSDFAYTSTGLVKDVFLEKCISMTRDPQQQGHVYCRECPFEKSKNDICLEACKGHLKRNFIKECWSKCGCNKQCGNRLVQRGITCNLQVFFTSDGKGWGLRTLEDLPKGTFVCEYIGEILTSEELNERNMQTDKSSKDTYLALLDAGWGSKTALKDEKALCLDASRYGNVARFINHRCLDANLVEIPVEVETPDHHYYHLAFFTARKIAALEELTWDYGIDFDDHDHPIKPFQCHCGSKFCRNMKRLNRSKSTSNSS